MDGLRYLLLGGGRGKAHMTNAYYILEKWIWLLSEKVVIYLQKVPQNHKPYFF